MKVESEIMSINPEVMELTKQLVKTEADLESANTATEAMKTYMSALIRENTELKKTIAKIKFIIDGCEFND